MQFFLLYEENRQDRAATVIVGTVSNAPASLVAGLRTREGGFTSPFREELLFGKAVVKPKRPPDRGHLQLAQRDRHPGIRRQPARFEAAENVENRVDSVQGKWQVARFQIPE